MFRKVFIVLVTDNDKNYKQSIKNVQSFHVIRFLTKITFVTRGVFYPTYCMEQNTPMGGVQCPPPKSKRAIFFQQLQQNQSTDRVFAYYDIIKLNIITIKINKLSIRLAYLKHFVSGC